MSLRRTLGLGLWASALLACGALTGLDEYSEGPILADGGPSTTSGSSSGATSSGSTSSSSGTASSSASSSGSTSSSSSSSGGTDAAADVAKPDPCPAHPGETPPRKLTDDTCTKNSDCCSDHCNFDNKCKGDCKQGGVANCSNNGDCCVGYYCSAFACAGCRLSGNPAEVVLGAPRPDSCCSKSLSGNNCK